MIDMNNTGMKRAALINDLSCMGKCSLSVEIIFAKETKNCLRPLRKTPRLNTSEGLQYGLSGNQVIQSATLYPAF